MTKDVFKRRFLTDQAKRKEEHSEKFSCQVCKSIVAVKEYKLKTGEAVHVCPWCLKWYKDLLADESKGVVVDEN